MIVRAQGVPRAGLYYMARSSEKAVIDVSWCEDQGWLVQGMHPRQAMTQGSPGETVHSHSRGMRMRNGFRSKGQEKPKQLRPRAFSSEQESSAHRHTTKGRFLWSTSGQPVVLRCPDVPGQA